MSKRKRSTGRVLFSTDRSHDTTCPDCGFDPCRCSTAQAATPHSQSPRVQRESKGRAGKTVTVIYDLELGDDNLKELARTLKQHCGTGGTVKDGVIEIQGNHRDKLVAKLIELGYRAKAAGG